jgi:beta-1,4-mannosyltransferase
MDVDIIGYPGKGKCFDELESHPRIKKQFMQPVKLPSFVDKLFILRSLIKPILQLWTLFHMLLFKIKRPDFLIVQNPPAIPTLFVAHIICLLRRSKLIIDFHNYGYTIMEMSKSGHSRKNHPLVKIAKWYERRFGRGAYANLCVSQAMQADLRLNWKIEANVLYDRPPVFFKEAKLQEKEELLQKYDFGKDKNNEIAFFAKKKLREDRPALIVSSTSWTIDEDFGILFDAVELCEKKVEEFLKQNPKSKKGKSIEFPQVHLVVTGDGDMRKYYEDEWKKKNFNFFRLFTVYLPYSDYATLLGSADFGICLHTSSSKVDLPMKVVDMFGCSLPVIAYHYPCLQELVQENKTGFTFKNTQELSQYLFDLLSSFPNTSTLDALRTNIHNTQANSRWNENWARTVLPLLKTDNKKKK